MKQVPVSAKIVSDVAWDGVKMELRSKYPSTRFMYALWGKFCALVSLYPDDLEIMSRKNESGFLCDYLVRHTGR
jgi:hypothetical protein